MWQKDRELQQILLDRYQDRPWDHPSRGLNKGGSMVPVSLTTAVVVGLLFLWSALAG